MVANNETRETQPIRTIRGELLRADDVTRSFGGVVAVDVRSFAVVQDSITAIIGPNGAGKSTFLNVLSGFERADTGTWTLNDKEITGLPPHRIAQAGLIRTFQLTRSLAGLTVLENATLAVPRPRGEQLRAALATWRWKPAQRRIQAQAMDTLAHFGLADKSGDLAGTLSGGQRKLLEMARAIMAEPSLLVLDEPMAGVNPALAESIAEHMRSLRQFGITTLFVEHNMDIVMDVSDYVVCMAQGAVIARGTPRDVAADPSVVDAYLGHR